MFESAELGQRVDKATYDAEVPQLRADLLDLQYDLLAARRFPVLILVNVGVFVLFVMAVWTIVRGALGLKDLLTGRPIAEPRRLFY